jgi:hypothetical protein
MACCGDSFTFYFQETGQTWTCWQREKPVSAQNNCRPNHGQIKFILKTVIYTGTCHYTKLAAETLKTHCRMLVFLVTQFGSLWIRNTE